MTLHQFTANYDFQITKHIDRSKSTIEVFTKMIRKKDKMVLHLVHSSLDIQDTSQLIADTQSEISLTPMDWTYILDQTVRGQLDFYARHIPIIDFFPLAPQTDVSPYIK